MNGDQAPGQLALDLGIPDPHPAFVRRRLDVAVAQLLEATDRPLPRLLSGTEEWIRPRCYGRPVLTVITGGGVL